MQRTNLFKVLVVTTISTNKDFTCWRLNQVRHPKGLIPLKTPSRKVPCCKAINVYSLLQLNIRIPIHLDDVFRCISPSLQVCANAETTNHFTYLAFQFSNRFIIEMVVMVMADEQVVYLRHV